MEAMASVRSSTTNNSDIIPNPSSVTSSTNSVPNNPHRTANPVVQFSGTVESFNNYEFLQLSSQTKPLNTYPSNLPIKYVNSTQAEDRKALGLLKKKIMGMKYYFNKKN